MGYTKTYKVSQGSLYQILVIVTGSLIALTSGIFITWPSSSIPIIMSGAQSFTLSANEATILMVLPSFAIVLSSPLAGKLIDSIGRKKTLLLIAGMQFATWLLIAFGDSKATLFLARTLNGIEDSCAFAALPSYISEVATPRIRGTWGNSIAFLVYFGNFIMNVVGTYFSITQTACIFAIIPAVFMFVFVFFPESPYYLLIVRKENEAREALALLRSGDNIDGELMQLKADIDRQLSESSDYKDLFRAGSNRRALCIAAFIRGAQQFSGITVFLMYAEMIFDESAGDISASLCAIIFSGFMVCTNLVSSCLVDVLGRRIAMFVSSLGCALVLAVQATFYFVQKYSDLNLDCLRMVPLVCMVVFIVVYSLGLGVVPTLMLGELFKSNVKGKAMCLINVFYGACIAGSTGFYTVLKAQFGLEAVFAFFAVCCFATSIVSYHIVPETKGKTLEEIQQLFKDQGNNNSTNGHLENDKNVVKVITHR